MRDFPYHLQDAQGEVRTSLGETPVNFDEGVTRIITDLYIYTTIQGTSYHSHEERGS